MMPRPPCVAAQVSRRAVRFLGPNPLELNERFMDSRADWLGSLLLGTASRCSQRVAASADEFLPMKQAYRYSAQRERDRR